MDSPPPDGVARAGRSTERPQPRVDRRRKVVQAWRCLPRSAAAAATAGRHIYVRVRRAGDAEREEAAAFPAPALARGERHSHCTTNYPS
ncbi:hypothetical protein E2562_024701 [Oryza meyeriana var. granulata]|uniref:Uncharacterized protein n=1 Tax=Oryza meyeriana var. granulata TaxID=110450 RepID=A0A6G1D787_9ORYZ|nr:hypothetical protein E2562_024701 [Oryza meyeriana var. granulata]